MTASIVAAGDGDAAAAAAAVTAPDPAVAIGDAATHGGAAHLWRRPRHLC